MPNDAGLGPIAYTAQPLPTTLTVRIPVLKAVKLIPLTGRTFRGGFPVNIADGATVTGTRVDAVGSASGTTLTDEMGGVWGVFGSAVAAGTWDMVTS